MNDTVKRCVGYGVGGATLAGLVFAGFVWDPDADAMTLLSSANTQLSLVHSFPEKDKDGKPNAARARLLEEVSDLIRRARLQEPDLHAALELEAHLCWVNGDYQRAATLFHDAQSGADSTPETTVIDRLNEARMWRAAGSPDKALAVLEPLGDFLMHYGSLSRAEHAHVLLETKRNKEAVALARDLSRVSKDANTVVEMGLLLESQNETADAEAAYRGVLEANPLVNYFLARLKIRNGEFDSGLGLLKKAVAANSRRVGIMLKHDAELWSPVSDDSRFKDLCSTAGNATPGR